MSLTLRFAALSDVGRVRRDNQDSGYAGPHLLAVADGVGGAARGDVASTAAIQQLRTLDHAPDNDADQQLAGAVHLAHSRIADLVSDNPELDGTSTTATAILFDGSLIHIAHVGDSRAYLLRDGELQPLTKDHTFVQSLVDEGRITEDEARVHPHRNLILRAVDGVREPEPDVSAREVRAGDRLLLCSDGCCGVLEDPVLAELLAEDPLEHVPGSLVGAALNAGSTDNVTVIVAEVTDEPGSAEGATPLIVGAAGGEARPATGWIARRRRTDEPEVDPEVLRYAPRPPRRFLALRRMLLLVVVLALIAAAGFAGYQWTQSRYYVGVHNANVAIYRGVNWQLPLIDLDHLQQESGMPAQLLAQNDQAQLEDGIPVDNLADAQLKMRVLIARGCTSAQAAAKEHARAEKAAKAAAKKARAHKKTTTSPTPSPSRPADTTAVSVPTVCGAS